MTTLKILLLKQSDFQRIASLIRSRNSETTQLLEEELNRALVVDDEQLLPNVVAMNSRVKFKDLDSGKESTVTLTFPEESPPEENCVSILAPVGAALIGLSVGQSIEWPFPNGKQRTLEVLSVVQPAEIQK